MDLKKLFFQILKYFKPKYYNRFTWILLICGIGLLSSPLIEKLIIALFEKITDIKIITDDNAKYGLILIIVSLVYNLISQLLDYYIQTKLYNLNPKQLEEKKLDIELFIKIRKIIPSDGSMKFIRKNNFNGFPFDWKEIHQIHNFRREMEKPESTFFNEELEDLKIKLNEILFDFNTLLSRNTFVLQRRPHMSSVPSEWETEQPERFSKVTKEISNKQDDAWVTFCDLITKGRDVLGV